VVPPSDDRSSNTTWVASINQDPLGVSIYYPVATDC